MLRDAECGNMGGCALRWPYGTWLRQAKQQMATESGDAPWGVGSMGLAGEIHAVQASMEKMQLILK